MSGAAGLRQIARFNWPWYAAAVATLVGGALLLRSEALGDPWRAPLLAALVAAGFWLLASLAVSHYVYDRSGIARGAWLDAIDPARVRRAAVLHAGQDEASRIAARALPQAELAFFDFYAPGRNGSPSLRRARSLAERSAVAVAPDHLPLDDGALDLGLLVFAAHEIRRDTERAAFFGELLRVLAPGGRLIVVEHLRDVWNVLAFGPGAWHFQSRKTWGRCFNSAGLRLLGERRCTPFVRVFELGRA